MDTDFVIDVVTKLHDSVEMNRHKHILEGSGPFYAGVSFALSVVLILLRSSRPADKR